MTKHLVLPAFGALLLAGCNGGGGTPTNTVTVTEQANSDEAVGNASGGGAAVAALSDRQRNAVFIRAILDAGLKCDAVTSSERIDDQSGQPTWRANCGPNNQHVISISQDGTATINSRTD